METANPYAPPRASVTDIAEERKEEHELAGAGVRLGAYLVDTVIFFLFIYVPILIGTILMATSQGDFTPAFLLIMLVGVVAWFWLTILFLARNGQTIAKKMLGIKAVRSDGSKASLGRLFWLRHVLSFVLSQTGIYFLIDVLFIFSESRQCLHDKIADTIVVVA
jgi:uncharacterized RDD family membrane protein YckC